MLTSYIDREGNGSGMNWVMVYYDKNTLKFQISCIRNMQWKFFLSL